MYGQISLTQQTLGYDGFSARRTEERARRRAAQRFSNLHWQATLSARIGKLFGRRSELRDLHADSRDATVVARRHAGTQLVPLSAIRGSEGRTDDFDAHFRPLQAHDEQRWIGVAAAVSQGAVLPPVDLVQLGDTYYVRDGHHRLSIAAAQGQTTVEAQVTVWEIG